MFNAKIYANLVDAMTQGWNAAESGMFPDADYGYDFTDYFCEQVITPCGGKAFEAGFFAFRYQNDYYRNCFIPDIEEGKPA